AVGAFFFSSRRRHTRFSRDWSSDVCSSDLVWQSLWGRNKSRFPIGQGRSGHLSFYSLGRDCLYHKKLLHPSRQPLYRESPEPDAEGGAAAGSPLGGNLRPACQRTCPSFVERRVQYPQFGDQQWKCIPWGQIPV